MKSVTLDKAELSAVLKAIPYTNKTGIRLVTHLAENPESPTVDVNRNAILGNISDIARKINPTLFKFGLFISCHKPARPLKNRLGDETNMFLWSIYRLPNEGKAANDPAAAEQAS